VARHLTACPGRQQEIAKAEKQSGDAQVLYHLRAQDAWRGEFWLDLEVGGSALLKDLDNYLRAIWLECCSHLSQFSIGGWRGREIPMRRRVDQVFRPGVDLTHIYDFGTSSESVIKMVGTRTGQPITSWPIALLVRNVRPEAECSKCEQPATMLCKECLIEENVWGALCDAHALTHPHDEYGEPIPLVNSPRLGMCGYTGPAEPPY
jgi:hypothetical protein